MTSDRNPRSDLGPGEDSAEHRQSWELLPWLANGTLEGDELHQVLDHLKVCGLCRDELRFLPELRFVVEQEELGTAPAPEAERPLAGVLDRIEAHEAEQRPAVSRLAVSAPREPEGVRDTWVRWWRRRVSARAGHWGGPVLAAQALVLLLVVGLAGSWALVPDPRLPEGVAAQGPDGPGRFTTLSQEEPRVGEGPRVRLIFSDEARERELRQLLLDHGATIVDGPNSLGAYTVRWPSLDEATLDALRRRPELKFVEPVALEPVALEPVALEPVALEPVALEPVAGDDP